MNLKIQHATIDALQEIVERILMKSFESKYILLIMFKVIATRTPYFYTRTPYLLYTYTLFLYTYILLFIHIHSCLSN
jgi:hypothetical protein